MVAEMGRVLLFCSVHREMGNATAAELHWFLDRLRPDVLFLEHSPATLEAFLDGSSPGNVELAAARRYQRRQPVELVPVGVHLEAAELKPKFDELFRRVEEASPRFRMMELKNLELTLKGGHAYLNSPACAELQSAMRLAMRTTVETIGESAVSEQYSLWTSINNQRELAILNGVEAYARRTSFNRGVLLVGAAHRDPLVRKSQLLRRDGPSPVAWDFDWELPHEAP